MPIAYRIDPSSGVLLAKGVGMLTEADVAQFAERLRNDPHYFGTSGSLVDFSEATFDVPTDRIAALAGAHRQTLARPRGARVAIVASSDLNYGLARIYAHYRSLGGSEVEPFRDEAGARAWLQGRDEAGAPN